VKFQASFIPYHWCTSKFCFPCDTVINPSLLKHSSNTTWKITLFLTWGTVEYKTSVCDKVALPDSFSFFLSFENDAQGIELPRKNVEQRTCMQLTWSASCKNYVPMTPPPFYFLKRKFMIQTTKNFSTILVYIPFIFSIQIWSYTSCYIGHHLNFLEADQGLAFHEGFCSRLPFLWRLQETRKLFLH